jgi:hypothetical protein
MRLAVGTQNGSSVIFIEMANTCLTDSEKIGQNRSNVIEHRWRAKNAGGGPSVKDSGAIGQIEIHRERFFAPAGC